MEEREDFREDAESSGGRWPPVGNVKGITVQWVEVAFLIDPSGSR